MQIITVMRGGSSIKTLGYENVKKATFHKRTVEKSNVCAHAWKTTPW